jgi:ATP-dependent Clp protease protease subunit
MQNYIVPYVVKKTSDGERSYDIYSRMLEERVVFCQGTIDDDMANAIVSQLLYLDSQEEKPISMYVNSPGGSINAGCAIIDTMDYVKSPVRTIGLGECASMGAVILTCGEKGMRMVLPRTRILIHQASSQARGQVLDMKTQYAETEFMNELMLEVLAERTGKDKKTIRKDVDRDFWMSGAEAVKYGLIDKVL